MHKINPLTRTFLLFLFGFSTVSSVGQSIDSLEIIPGAPIGVEDQVSVIAAAWHPSQGCPIEDTEFFFSQDTITVVVEHLLGLATAICNSVDTTVLGSFAQGTYKVEYIMISGLFGDEPSVDTAYTEFTVEGVNATSEFSTHSMMKVYPNPSYGNLFIETEWRGQMGVYDLMGKELENFRIDKSPFQLPTGGLAPGVYFLVSPENRTEEVLKFIVR